jgi:hypothetical protein
VLPNLKWIRIMHAREFLEKKGIYALDTKKRTNEVLSWMEEYAELQRNKALRKATKIAYENFQYGEFTVTNKILKMVSDYPEVPFDWPTKK